MPSFKSLFPSTYVKASDIPKEGLVVTIAKVCQETVGTGDRAKEKPVAYFQEPGAKPLVLNMTNCGTIADLVGSEYYETWAGHRIKLIPARVDFQGKRVDCIRIEAPPVAPVKRRIPTPVVLTPDDIESGEFPV